MTIRTCPECGARLRRDNAGPLCSMHEEKLRMEGLPYIHLREPDARRQAALELIGVKPRTAHELARLLCCLVETASRDVLALIEDGKVIPERRRGGFRFYTLAPPRQDEAA